MRQIKYATTIPQIYHTTIIIGACRVMPRNDEGSGFDMGKCWWNDALMDQKRLAQLGRHQTWLSPQRADGFVYTYSSEMITRILLHIREACDKAKETSLPTEILVILYGLGNPAIGCHMDCTKDFLEPGAIITPTMILNELPPGRDVTLAMRMFSTRPGAHIYSLQESQLDEHTRAFEDVHKTAAANGTLIKQAFTEGDVLDYRISKKDETLEEHCHYELALWLRKGPKDTDGYTVVKDRILQFMDPYPRETMLQCRARLASLATVVIFRLSMAFLTDNMVAKFKLKRPQDQTCLEWDMPRWLERRANLTRSRSNEWYDLFKIEEEIETKDGLLWSRYTRFRLYLRAAHFETYLAEEEIRYTQKAIDRALVNIEGFFDSFLENQVEKSATACKELVKKMEKEYGNESPGQIAKDPNRWEDFKIDWALLFPMTCDQYPVVPPRE
ncbi:ORF20 [Fusarium tjaetaba]|uniref:ORF20 n=1 Tax=Fusarium tjaetaba TaxID=1567544 RepID=A0A8H5S6U9_9HYPO|nr:ORF20 [Fusarium tjaetaba]KAF5647591.1 ORF20 [Fusarium tjaetaba]